MFYAGFGNGGPVYLEPESHLLVLGPPRSGKTMSIVVPNILSASGPLIATSTKPDLINLTYSQRCAKGRVFVFDPSDTLTLPGEVTRVSWSPINHKGSFSDALSVTRAMFDSLVQQGAGHGGYSHWVERAGSLVAPMIHAAQIGGYEMDTVMRWLNNRECRDPAGILKACGEDLALDSLKGVLITEERERSGIFSTALGLFASYNYPELLRQDGLERFEIEEFLRSENSLYIVSPAHVQSLVAPVIVGLIDSVKNKSFEFSSNVGVDSKRRPLVLILDEMANVAPLGSLSSILSEGASQKVMLLGALQDLSQARVRWGEASTGFLTLFGSTLVLPGISDSASLRQLSEISGTMSFDSISQNYRGSRFSKVFGPISSTRSQITRPLLEPWEIARSKGGQGFLFRRSHEVRRVLLPQIRDYDVFVREIGDLALRLGVGSVER